MEWLVGEGGRGKGEGSRGGDEDEEDWIGTEGDGFIWGCLGLFGAFFFSYDLYVVAFDG